MDQKARKVLSEIRKEGKFTDEDSEEFLREFGLRCTRVINQDEFAEQVDSPQKTNLMNYINILNTKTTNKLILFD